MCGVQSKIMALKKVHTVTQVSLGSYNSAESMVREVSVATWGAMSGFPLHVGEVLA